ncbi:MAG: hypothetical protein KatS3mg105_1823 [Gemmatales bacterium]|nr:MAG: hypothetical protein KatS3mg105_1823 [Gemmatales bacterium]
MEYDPQRVRHNVLNAETEDLLDRVTVYRAGMEPDALEIIEMELKRRGISEADIDQHAELRRQTVLLMADGIARTCNFCDRPAVVRQWSWHRLWGLLPVFPRRFDYCDRHRPAVEQATPEES